MIGRTTTRMMEDVDASTLNYAEVKAIATGNPKIRRKMELELEVAQLKTLEQQHMLSKHQLQDKIAKVFPARIATLKNEINILTDDIKARDANTAADFFMKIGSKPFNEKKEAGELLIKAVASGKYADKAIGEYRGFTIIPQPQAGLDDSIDIILQREKQQYNVRLSESETGSIQRIDNVLNDFENDLLYKQRQLSETLQQLDTAKTHVNDPFEHETELEMIQSELNEINQELDIGKEDTASLIDEDKTPEGDVFLEESIIEEEIEEDMELEYET